MDIKGLDDCISVDCVSVDVMSLASIPAGKGGDGTKGGSGVKIGLPRIVPHTCVPWPVSS